MYRSADGDGGMPSPKVIDFDGTIKSWAKTTCERTSLHGPAWYSHIDNQFTKLTTIFLAIVSFVGLPFFVSYEVFAFSQDYQVLTSCKEGFFTNMHDVSHQKTFMFCSFNNSKGFSGLSKCDNMSFEILQQVQITKYVSK